MSTILRPTPTEPTATTYAPTSSVMMHSAPTYGAPVAYAGAPVTYAAAPTTSISHAPVTYAAAPTTSVSYAHAPVAYASSPVAYASAPSYQQQPIAFGSYPSLYAAFSQPGAKITPELYDKLRTEFHSADKGGTGELDHNELATVMQKCGVPGGDPTTLKTKFAEFDTDGNGKVSFSEFMSTFHSKPLAPPPKDGDGAVGADGKWTDKVFPPNNDSLYKSPNPAADHVSDVQAHCGGADKTVEWKRASDLVGGVDKGALFQSVHPNDIAQGILGDCWFLAALAGLAEFEGAVFQLFQQKTLTKDCKYTINVYNCQTKMWDCVTIDDYIPIVKGEPVMAKPQGHEMWVLLLEKAFAKWFGSYCQIQGAYCMVAYMLLVDCPSPCKVFTQAMNGRAPFNEEQYHVVDAILKDPKNRNSVGLTPKGMLGKDQVWEELKNADASNHIMAAWTGKDPEVATGKGASGEIIASDGIVKGHAYSLLSAKEVTRDDGVRVRAVQLRNPWGANPAAEYKGELADTWSEWSKYPRMKKELLGDGGKLDGQFWMTFENFVKRYSDCGIVPKAMETPRMGQCDVKPMDGHKHGRRPKPAQAASPKKAKGKKKMGCC